MELSLESNVRDRLAAYLADKISIDEFKVDSLPHHGVFIRASRRPEFTSQMRSNSRSLSIPEVATPTKNFAMASSNF